MNITDSRQTTRFHVALSFAGEDRKLSEAVANGLKRKGVSVFYDSDYQSELWGADIPVKLRDIYSSQSKYCILFLSDYYKKKMWTNFERQQILEKALAQYGNEYLLPVRIDGFNDQIPGLSNNIGYISVDSNDPEKIIQLFLDKINMAELEKNETVDKEEWVLVVSGTLKNINKARAEAIVKHLRSILGDSELTLEKILEGSIKLVLKGSRHGLESAVSLLESGLLKEVLGYEVIEISSDRVSVLAISSDHPSPIRFDEVKNKKDHSGITKDELAEQLFEKRGLNKDDLKKMLDIFLEQINNAHESGKDIKLSGFGTFSLREENQGSGQNKKSGKEISTPRRQIVTFRPGLKH